jgi:predicted glycoside hydrolase/deacetylase ChbG (UPF0249 family)
MLIVNADDFGRCQEATDAILACFAKGRITSTSAMVFMADSERAARAAGTSGIEVGVHLNFTETFTSELVPEKVRQQHDRIRRFLSVSKYALLFYNPFLRCAFKEVFEAQCNEFMRLYGSPPAHMDGHQHMHLCSNILIDRILPYGTKVRRSFSFGSNDKNFLNRFYRFLVDCALARRHRLTDYFFALSPHLSVIRLRRVLELARSANVELMTHPQVKTEYDFLVSDEYSYAMSQVHLAGYNSL